MSKTVALDSNALTYLLDAISEGYLPHADPDSISAERSAMFRLFCYGGCPLWVSPTVRTEYLRITAPAKRELHDRWARYQLEDVEPTVAAFLVDARATDLNNYHDDLDDCHIVAEAEAAGAEILVTSDGDLIANLSPHSRITILRASELLASLAIAQGTTPTWIPAEGNPLSGQTWWRI